MPSPIDFVTLADVKTYLQGTGESGTSDDSVIANHITGLSAYLLRDLGRGNPDDSTPTQNPFLTPVTYTEVRDGNGHAKLFLRNNPIKAVSSLIIGSQLVPLSSGFGQAGYGVAGNAKYIFLRSGSGGLSCGGNVFNKGIQNVQVVYQAGYNACPPDLFDVCVRSVALIYKRKNWLGMKSKSMGNGAGNVVYAEWEFTPYDTEVFAQYRNWTY